MTVGWKDDGRTKAKHRFLSRSLGKEIGAATKVSRRYGIPYRRHLLVDLTAGDAEPKYEGAWHESCSPGIFAHHARFDRVDVPVFVRLYEKERATYEILIENLHDYLPELGYRQTSPASWEAHEGRVQLDAYRDSGLNEIFRDVGTGDFLFVQCDPNNVHQWPLNNEALLRAVRRGSFVRSFLTLGCNAGGIQRLDLSMREQWYGHVGGLISTLRPNQDLVVCAIDRDMHKFGYLIVTPKVWVGDEVAAVRKFFGEEMNRELHVASMCEMPVEFNDLLDQLFLRKDERREQ